MSDVRVGTIFQAVDRMTRPMGNMQKGVRNFSRRSNRNFRSVSDSMNSMRNIARLAVGAFVTDGIARDIGSLVSAAADLEGVTTQFETLTGSIENANHLVDELRSLTARTPLQFEDIAQGAQRLLAFGIVQEDINDTMQTLGDTALGNSQRLESLVRAYGKVSARGKASMEEINMVIDAGVPIMDELAKGFGVTIEELQKMIRDGAVTADVFQDAFKSMTSEGGQFFRGMERQSQTFNGLVSTMKDNITILAGTLGTALLPHFKVLTARIIEISQAANEWVMNNEDLIKAKLDQYIDNIGKALQFLVTNWQNGLIPAVLASVAAFTAFIKIATALRTVIIAVQGAKLAAAAAGGILNAVMAANPFGLIVLTIAAVTAGIVILINKLGGLQAIMDRMTRARERLFGAFNEQGGAGSDAWDTAGGGNNGVMTRNSNSTSTSRLEVDFSGMPAGARTRQTGSAPGISVNTGGAASLIGATP